MTEPSPFLTRTEAAALLRLDPRSLDNMRQRGTGPLYVKHGSRVFYRQTDVLASSSETRRKTTTEKVADPVPVEPEPVPDDPAVCPTCCTARRT
jgi:hypothetical protein